MRIVDFDNRQPVPGTTEVKMAAETAADAIQKVMDSLAGPDEVPRAWHVRIREPV